MRPDSLFLFSLAAFKTVFCANAGFEDDEKWSDSTAISVFSQDSGNGIIFENEDRLSLTHVHSESDLEMLRQSLHNRLTRNFSHLQARGLITEESRIRLVNRAVDSILADIFERNSPVDFALDSLCMDLEVGIKIELELQRASQDDSLSCCIS